MDRNLARVLLLAAIAALASIAVAQQRAATNTVPSSVSTSVHASVKSSSNTAAPVRPEISLRVQGEQRFRQNCGRCHMAPQKFPPRMMGTILRHMRVRATITDADARLILQYMTQ